MDTTLAYRNYEEIAQLNTPEQRHILQTGDAVERVWAAWALGMTLGAQTLPQLLLSLDKSPDPGTRRHLLVVLAGLGEQEVLRVLAEGDPDPYVRATACQYLIRTGDLTNTLLGSFLRERLLIEPCSVVKQDLLADLPGGFAILAPEDLARLVDDDGLEVRQLAIERLLTDLPHDQLFPGPLEDRIPREQNQALRRLLLETCLRAGGGQRLVSMAQTLAPERRQEILSLLVEQEIQLGWRDLAPLAARSEPAEDALVVRILGSDDTLAALPWLLNRIAGYARAVQSHASSADFTFLWRAEQLLIAASPRLEGLAEGSFARDEVQAAVAYFERNRDPAEEEEWEEHEEYQEWYRAIDRLIAALKRAAAVR
jgi:hypothetical protein